MTLVPRLTLTLVLTSALPAQSVSATFVAHTDMTATAGAVRRIVRARRDLTGGLLLQASYSLMPEYASGVTTVGFRHSPAGTLASITDSASAMLAWGHLPLSAATGSHDTLLTFVATKRVRAKLVVTAASNGLGASKDYRAEIDIGNDQQIDFAVGFGRASTKEFAVTVDPRGLPVRTRTLVKATSARMLSQASAIGTLTIRLVPDPTCTASSYGRSCGPVLRAGPATFQSRLELHLTNATPNTSGRLLLGLRQLDLRLPGTSCRLHTDPLVVLPIASDNFGGAVHRIALPPGLRLAFNAQDVLLPRQGGRVVLSSTNGLRIDCK